MKRILIFLLFFILFLSFININRVLSNEPLQENLKEEFNDSDAEEKKISEIEKDEVYNQISQKLNEEKYDNLLSFKEILENTYYNNDSLNAEKEKTKSVKAQKINAWSNVLPTIGIDINYGRAWYKDKSMRELIYKDYGNVMNNSIYLY